MNDDYIICPICFPEYVHCDEKCENCDEYIEFVNYYKNKGSDKNDQIKTNKN